LTKETTKEMVEIIREKLLEDRLPNEMVEEICNRMEIIIDKYDKQFKVPVDGNMTSVRKFEKEFHEYVSMMLYDFLLKEVELYVLKHSDSKPDLYWKNVLLKFYEEAKDWSARFAAYYTRTFRF
jgi:hypothetical protein